MTSLRAGRGGASVVPVVLRAGLSIALFLVLAWWLDVAQIVARLSQMRSGWVLAALGLSVVQVLVSAWRWRFTAGRLGIDLPFGEAVREYYLSMFVNQVLPGGVVGDVSRAWRHAAAQRLTTSSGGPAIRAVVLERLSGQLVMVGVASASVLTLLGGSGDAAWLVVLVGLATVVALRQWVKAPTRDADDAPSSLLARLWHDTKVALLDRYRSADPARQLGRRRRHICRDLSHRVVGGWCRHTLTNVAAAGGARTRRDAHPRVGRGLGGAGNRRRASVGRCRPDERRWRGDLDRIRLAGTRVVLAWMCRPHAGTQAIRVRG